MKNANVAGVIQESRDYEDARLKLLKSVSKFRPRETVFEFGHRGSKGKTLAAEIMRARRSKITIKADEPTPVEEKDESDAEENDGSKLTKDVFRDPEHYIAHFQPGNTVEEQAYEINRSENSFANASHAVMMNLVDRKSTRLNSSHV